VLFPAPAPLEPVGDLASTVESASAAYFDITVAPHEYFDQKTNVACCHQARSWRDRPPAPEDIAEMAKLSALPAWQPEASDGDYSIGPDYAPAAEQTKRAGVPEGKVVEFVMNSAESKFYPGVSGPFQRHVCVYVPAQYVPGTATPVIVSADAYGMHYGLPTILDNMIADHRLSVMVAVMIANGGAERSMEYDTVSVKYADYVEAEVLPRAEMRPT
jgi:hypothetical protein